MSQHLVTHISQDRRPTRRVVHMSDSEAERLFHAFQARTRRNMFVELCRQPQTTSELAETVNRSLQTVQYHLTELEQQELVEPVGSATSVKARQMDVYGPTEIPVILTTPKSDSIKHID